MSEAAVRTIRFPSGEAVPVLGQGTWAWREERGAATERDRRAPARPRPRHDAHRHRRDVRRRRRRGARRRSDRRAPRRRLPGQQGAAAERDAARDDRRVRAQPAAARNGPARPVSAALARRQPLAETLAAFESSSRPARSATGASAISTSTDMEELCRTPGRKRCRDQPGALQPDAARHRVRSAALVPAAGFRSWPTRRSSRAGCSSTRRCRGGGRHGATPAQVALAWVLRQDGVIAIPKAGMPRMCAKTAPRSTCASRRRKSTSSTRVSAAARTDTAGNALSVYGWLHLIVIRVAIHREAKPRSTVHIGART